MPVIIERCATQTGQSAHTNPCPRLNAPTMGMCTSELEPWNNFSPVGTTCPNFCVQGLTSQLQGLGQGSAIKVLVPHTTGFIQRSCRVQALTSQCCFRGTGKTYTILRINKASLIAFFINQGWQRSSTGWRMSIRSQITLNIGHSQRVCVNMSHICRDPNRLSVLIM